MEKEKYLEEYISFLNECKTTRETIEYIESELNKAGFKKLDEISEKEDVVKVYKIYNEKLLIAAVVPQEFVSKLQEVGFRVIAAHVDSPRLDLKPKPIVEDSGIIFLKTHYYGGIKKYQWVNIPLALHGIIVKKDGSKVKIVLGEKEDEPKFIIPDLSAHLSKKQLEKQAAEFVEGEQLMVMFGHSEKKNIVKLLREMFNIDEEDLFSSELSLVPAYKAGFVGLDKKFIGGYGQDDRSCVFAELKAFLDVANNPELPVMVIFVDREEIGSEGNTSAKSYILENFMLDLIEKITGSSSYSRVRKILEKSKAISADVTTILNPLFKEAYDVENTAKAGKGVVIMKYCGIKGKYHTNEPSAEYLAWIRKCFDENKVPWQTGTIGKIDLGGGGTIAMFLANRGMEVVDIGPGIMNLHSPYEIAHADDLYATYLAYKAFFFYER